MHDNGIVLWRFHGITTSVRRVDVFDGKIGCILNRGGCCTENTFRVKKSLVTKVVFVSSDVLLAGNNVLKIFEEKLKCLEDIFMNTEFGTTIFA